MSSGTHPTSLAPNVERGDHKSGHAGGLSELSSQQGNGGSVLQLKKGVLPTPWEVLEVGYSPYPPGRIKLCGHPELGRVGPRVGPRVCRLLIHRPETVSVCRSKPLSWGVPSATGNAPPAPVPYSQDSRPSEGWAP